jgi:hypothetical protein
MWPCREKMPRVLRATVPAVVACALLLLLAPTAGAAGAETTEVWFLRDGALVPVERHAKTLPLAVEALLSGPTMRERRAGLRSAVPTGTRVRRVSIQRRLVTVDLSARFAAGRDPAVLKARVGQLVRTVGGIAGVRGVRVRVEGGVPLGLFPGYDLRRALTAAAVKTEPRPGVLEFQTLLGDLGFMGPGGVSGELDDRTAVAVLAFQKWSGLPRTGELDATTARFLLRATRPNPRTVGSGRRVEVLLDRQLALLVEGGRVERAIHISTGAYNRTPVGTFHVFRKERMSWSVPFSVWMPWASYFVGGIAFHEYPSVPSYPASHGCVRVNAYDALRLYEFASPGTQVTVLSGTLA